jgi:ERCC4-type nuclease
MILLIDYRERGFIKKVKSLENLDNQKCIIDESDEEINGRISSEQGEGEFKWGNINVKYSILNLEVGDFIIKDNDDIKIIIERKSIKDLCSSIVDGRFREQKERLIESVNDVKKILYIIEGHKNKNSSGISKMIIDGAILNLMYRHNYKVLNTENENDTFENILLIYKKIANGDFEMGIEINNPVKMIKKGNKIAENIMAIQLSIIPGLSYNTSCVISGIYKNMKELIDAYNKCEDEESCGRLLMDIQINNKRKIGLAMSKKIYESTMK